MRLVTYIGGLLTIEVYKGVDVSDAEIAVLNADGTAYDFTGGTGFELVAYLEKNRRRKIFTSTNLTINANVISWSDNWVDININFGDYWQDLRYVDSSGNSQVVEFGTFKVI